jgi:exonuclease SbcD
MKILHTADWHLGAYVGPQCDDPMKRMENTIECLDVLVETARREEPDIILICGDIWHQAKVWSERSNVELRIVADYIDKLKDISFVIVLYGTPNHDSQETFNSLVRMCGDVDCCFIDTPDLFYVDTRSGPIQVAGLPGFDKGHFRAQFSGLSAEEENQVFTQQLAGIVAGLSAQLDPAIPSVLMAHHTVVGCELDNGTHVFQANEVVLDAAALDNSNFDMVCLGHIHKAQRVETCNKPVYYAGSLDAFTFNDENCQKGFWVHYLNENWTGEEKYQYIGQGYTIGSSFISTPAREFFTLRFDQEYIKSLGWLGCNYSNKVVRILYTCDAETEKALDKKKLERDLYAAGAYYVSEIRPEKVTAAVNRERMHEKLTVEDCLAKYLYEKNILAHEAFEIIDNATPIIAEAQASSPMGTTSGLFLPIEIKVKNYRSYVEEKLSFEDIFFAMVNGANGVGKSSLFMDAVTDCLYEETREGELTGWIRNGEKSGSIIFTFRLGDDIWRVTRTRQRSGKGTLALAKGILYFADYSDEKPGDSGYEWQDQSCERLNDTQQKIIDLLGMDCDTFQSCVLIMQDRYGKFMEADKEDRMSVLANLLGLGIYDDLSEITREKLKEVNRRLRTLKEEAESLEAETSAEDDLHNELQQVQFELHAAGEDIRQQKRILTELYGQLGAIEGYVRESSVLEKDLKLKTESYTEKKNCRTELQGRVTETESFLRNEQNIYEKCSELDAARLEIAALDGKVKLLNDKRVRHDKLSRDLAAARQYRANTVKTLTLIAESLKDRERLEEIVNNNHDIELELEEYEGKAIKVRELEAKSLALNGDFTTFEHNAHEGLTAKRLRLEGYMKEAEMLENANCIDVGKACCRFLQSAKEAQGQIKSLRDELNALIADKNARGEEYAMQSKVINDEIKAVAYSAAYHQELIKKIKIYRDAKDQLAKLAASAATTDALKKQDAENAARIQEYENELEMLTKEIARLEIDTGKYDVLKSQVNELSTYEDLKQQLPKAKQFVESTTEAIQRLDTDIHELGTSITGINGRLVELSRLTAGREDINRKVLEYEAAVRDIEGKISGLNQKVGTINIRLLDIEKKKRALDDTQHGLRQAAKEAAQLQVLVEAFDQDGIPYQIIRDIVPELEASANEILGQMTGGRMRLEFITEKVVKSNKSKEIATLEIIIIDVDNGTLPYLSRSGGQKVRAALAVNFALANIKASRVGLQLGMMFVDEPPFLDTDGVEAYCAALETIHNKFPEMKLLAISHDENMKSMFPQQLYVDIGENGSRVRRVA